MSTWTTAVAATSPYGWWKLDDASASASAADASGNAHPGVYDQPANMTYQRPSLIPGDPTGAALRLNANTADLTISSLSYNNVGMTCAFTFKSTGSLTADVDWLYANFGWALRLTNGGTMKALLATTLYDMGYNVANVFDASAHFILMVIRTTSVELWVDGTMVGSATHNKTPATRTVFALKNANAQMPGEIDDLLLWNTALTSTQIGNLSTAWASGATVLTGGQAVEADTVPAGATHVSVPGNQAQETDTAGAGAVTEGAILVVGGLATETDSARAGTVLAAPGPQTRNGGIATETDLAPTGQVVTTEPPGPPAIAVQRWLLRDTATNAQWRMPINPDSMTSPLPRRQMKHAGGWRADQRVRTFITTPEATEWEWSGVIRTQAHYDQLVTWARKNVAVDVTDHLGRTFRVFITDFNPTDRRPTPHVPWRLRYSMKARILERVS